MQIIDNLFQVDGHYWSVTVALIMFYPYMWIEEITPGGRFSEKFLKVWKTIIFVMWIGAILGGTPKRLYVNFFIDKLIAVAELIGVWIGLLGFSLILTYILILLYKLINPLLKKIHDIANK
jgi:hypothetical protein